MAGATRLELATSGVTGRRSNQTELRPRMFFKSPHSFEQGIYLAILELAIFPLGKAGRSNQTELRPRMFFKSPHSFEQGIYLAILELAIFPLGKAGRSNQTELRPRMFF